jgi:RNA polymerase sigma factor (sigma-70 family)
MRIVSAVTESVPLRRVGPARPAFARVAEEELDAVHRYLLFLTGDRALAEDLTGETFEKAFRIWRRFDPRRGSARTWLCRIARSVALDHFRAERRRRRREEVYTRAEPQTAEAPFVDGVSAPLERALARLSPGEREVVALRVLLELDGPTAARVLGISHSACSTRLSRALHKLEERMTNDPA